MTSDRKIEGGDGVLAGQRAVTNAPALGQGPYVCMPREVLRDGALKIRAVEPRDIEAIRQWRNAQMEVLRQKSEISAAQQIEYFGQKVWPDKAIAEPSNILMAYIRADALMGFGGLVHIAWEHKRAEYVMKSLQTRIVRE